MIDQPDHWDYIGTWAPDGRRFFFYSFADNEKQIHIFDTQTGQFTHGLRDGRLPRWSRDGRVAAWVTAETLRYFEMGDLWVEDGVAWGQARRLAVTDSKTAWFAFEGEKLGQGRENTRIFLKENPQFVDKLRKKIEEKVAKENPLMVGRLTTGTSSAEDADLEDEEADDGEGSKTHAGEKAGRPASVRGHTKKGH